LISLQSLLNPQEINMKNARFFTSALVATIAAVACASFTAPAFANTYTPRVDKREANQQARINQGVASGELNQKETARLQAGQARVQGAEAAAKADGKVTKAERRKLNKMQNKQSKRIAKQKHDAQKAK
jgi:uncharacterized membrane protein YebE (DUF533 family)